jgi:hypothetical protein
MPTAVENGLIVGAFPTFGELIKLLTLSCTDCLTFVVVLLSPAMIVATFVLQNIHVSEAIEAGLQNFAAGLIIAAVAAELFPIMIDSAETPSYIGITIGILLLLVVIALVRVIIRSNRLAALSSCFFLQSIAGITFVFLFLIIISIVSTLVNNEMEVHK